MATAKPDDRDTRLEPSEDVLFDVLSNRRRRYTVHALKVDDARLDLGTLADRVAAWECGVSPGEVSRKQRKRAYTALLQSHLPMMEEAGVVQFDKSRGVVEPADNLDDVELYLDVVHGAAIPWSQYYLLLSVLASTLLIAQGIGVTMFSELSTGLTAILIAGAFLVSSSVHWLRARRNRLGVRSDPPELHDD